jgi:hypothetical protein
MLSLPEGDHTTKGGFPFIAFALQYNNKQKPRRFGLCLNQTKPVWVVCTDSQGGFGCVERVFDKNNGLPFLNVSFSEEVSIKILRHCDDKQ